MGNRWDRAPSLALLSAAPVLYVGGAYPPGVLASVARCVTLPAM